MGILEKLKEYEKTTLFSHTAKSFFDKSVNLDNIEKLFALYYLNVINSVTGFAANYGDDGGFILTLCGKSDKYYLYIMGVNYNESLDSFIMNEGDLRLDSNNVNNYENFVILSTLEAVGQYLNQFVEDLDFCCEMVEYYKSFDGGGNFFFDQYSRNIKDYITLAEEHNRNWSKKYCNFLRSCLRPYYDFQREYAEKMLDLVNHDNSDYYGNRAELLRAEHQFYISKINHLAYRIKNPDFFVLTYGELQTVNKYFYGLYYIKSEKIFIDISEDDILNLMNGKVDRLLLKSAFDVNCMSMVIKAHVLKEGESPDMGLESRDLIISTGEKSWSAKKFFFKRIIDVKDVLDILFNKI